ncbi:MAG: phage regulatory protein/antirepressor Ant [Finegoldia magna]|mgnify:CR=1 FL=1|nr:phage regulatory protein/antirepressor Ant [Finegoldia magna]
MNYLVEIRNVDGKGVVSSRTIAEQLGKRHSHVLESIEKIKEDSSTDISAQLIKSSYKDSSGKSNKEYLLTKDGFVLYMFNIQGYNDFKMAYINEFNRMEAELNKKKIALPQNYIEALEQLVDTAKENERLNVLNSMQSQQIAELKPKADYTDKILKSKSLVTITAIAKDYGVSGTEMNKILHGLGVQYKQGKQWLLYSRYQSNGYTHSETVEFQRKDGTNDVSMITKWTQKGRLFLYQALKENGFLPMIERA